jgi:hypothetical protein
MKETTGRSKSRSENNIKIECKGIVRDDNKIQWTLPRDEWQTSANVANGHHMKITEILEVIRIVNSASRIGVSKLNFKTWT